MFPGKSRKDMVYLSFYIVYAFFEDMGTEHDSGDLHLDEHGCALASC